MVIVGEKNIPEHQQFVERNAELSEPIRIPSSLIDDAAVIHFDEAATLFHKLGEESLLFFTVCMFFFFFCFCMARSVSFFNRPVALATKAEGNKAKEIKNTFFGVNYGFIIFFIRCNKLVQYQ